MAEAVKVEERRTKAYLVQLSKGDPVKIDEDELPKVLQAIQSGNPAIVRQGIVNPSYITSVVPDKDRIEQWLRECRYGHGQGDEARARGIKSLDDIMKTKEIAKQLGAGTPTKRLKG
jgi:hypothetical protein